MTRYRLITPHGIYAPGVILDTELPSGRPFAIEEPAARRLAELGVMEPLDEAGGADPEPRAQDEPGWTQTTSTPATSSSLSGTVPRAPRRKG
jgi:hypothetical protein